MMVWRNRSRVVERDQTRPVCRLHRGWSTGIFATLTGGYRVIASVATYHLDLAGQIPIHAGIRFKVVPGPLSLE
jgi:hypothetical protein